MEQIPTQPPESSEHVATFGSRVIGVGDLHVENFGTWRDAEGRLIWGVNDFDEAYRDKSFYSFSRG